MTEIAFGPVVRGQDTLFRIWAPKQTSVHLRLAGHPDQPMERTAHGWHGCQLTDISPGARYAFVLEDGLAVPDPASRFQPDGPHGQSELIDLDAYLWETQGWTGRPWEEMVIYELHVGAFTPEGTFDAARSKLEDLSALGVTAIQLMPVNDFPGNHGWGYDGVLPYAPFHGYGRPQDLQRFIDSAHGLGISVFLDVVYNHFGFDGNFLPAYAPVFSKAHHSPWGDGVNLDEDGSEVIREYFIQNALYWLREFRADGLRFDAIHALKDDSDEHFLQALARRIRETFTGRAIHLIVENEDNDSDLLQRDLSGEARMFTAQWNDDIHHVLHTAATGEDFGYYGDYAGDPDKIGRALAEGFVFQGEFMPYRGSERGKSSTALPPTAFISFIQNHDQIGNRAFGERLPALAPLHVRRALSAIYLLSPQIPMLFMGEEWDATEPFPYFCDFNDELKDTVREGRRKELSRLPGFEDSASTAPDPTERDTFLSAKLDWQCREAPDNASCLQHYRDLLAVRHKEIVPRLASIRQGGTYSTQGHVVAVEWALDTGERLGLLGNFGPDAAEWAGGPQGRTLWQEGRIGSGTIDGWSLRWSIL